MVLHGGRAFPNGCLDGSSPGCTDVGPAYHQAERVAGVTQ